MFPVFALLLPLGVAGLCSAASKQQTFSVWGYSEGADTDDFETYHLRRPIENVAIIGAGVSGPIAYRESAQAGLNVQMFERDTVPGGNWHCTEETARPASITNVDAVIEDFVPSLPPPNVQLPWTQEHTGSYTQIKRDHRGPKPIWETLHSNVPAPLQQITAFPWPAGTNWELSNYVLGRYLRAFASFHGLNSNDGNLNVSYDTRVERIDKAQDSSGNEIGWTLMLKELVQTDYGLLKAAWYTQVFDAVVVATGRKNAPYIPPITGLAELAKIFMDNVMHPRSFRRHELFANKTVLIVGAAVSGDWTTRVSLIWHSDLPLCVPRVISFVPEIRRFLPAAVGSDFKDTQIELILTNIDQIIFATGYRYSYPFLPQYHNSSIGVNGTAPPGVPQPLVTDGSHVRSLHLDLFYIDDPTLALLDMNNGMQSFTFSEYASVALSKVWTRKAFLPSTQEMWHWYDKFVKERGGYSLHFQFLGPARLDEYIGSHMSWLNTAARKYGGRRMAHRKGCLSSRNTGRRLA